MFSSHILILSLATLTYPFRLSLPLVLIVVPFAQFKARHLACMKAWLAAREARVKKAFIQVAVSLVCTPRLNEAEMAARFVSLFSISQYQISQPFYR